MAGNIEGHKLIDQRAPLSSVIPAEVLRLIPLDVQQSLVARLVAPSNSPIVLGYPFPVPIHPTDTPLIQHAGFTYICTGCGADIPDGTAVYEIVEDGMVIGLRMRGGTAPDGPVIHECGEVN